jgi:outer membrane autotransporter protein
MRCSLQNASASTGPASAPDSESTAACAVPAGTGLRQALLSSSALLALLAGPAVATEYFVRNDASLRSAISSATHGDTITFTEGITLESNLPIIRQDVLINGQGNTLSGNHQYRGLFVESASIALKDLRIEHALAQGGHGGAGNGGGGGGGGAGMGGALFIASDAQVLATNVYMTANRAFGGEGGIPYSASGLGSAGGGGGYLPANANGEDGSGSYSGYGRAGGGDGYVTLRGGNGSFGGGGGGSYRNTGGNGGYGGGAGAGRDGSSAGQPGWGGGKGNPWDGLGGGFPDYQGGYGASMGGAIFVQSGGKLTVAGNSNISGNNVDSTRAFDGFGESLFLHGSGTLTFMPGAGETQTVGGILDEGGPQNGFAEGDRLAGSWTLVKKGPGTLVIAGTGTAVFGIVPVYFGGAHSGGTIIEDGIVRVKSFLDGNIVNNGRLYFENPDLNGMTFWSARGDISGTGAVIIDMPGKPGTITFGGTNTYTGGTKIYNGTLRGNTRSLQGTIQNEDNLVFAQDFDGTFAGTMFGPGKLVKDGIGRVSLTGSNSVGGGTTIKGGTLAVNGPLTSNVIIESKGTLAGAGNVVGNIDNQGGTIAPGNSIGQISVNGNLTLTAGTLEMEINPDGRSDRISVVGAGNRLQINAGTLAIVPEAGIYTPGTRYTLITNEDGGEVRFDAVTGGPGFLKPALSIDRHNLHVSLILPANAFSPAAWTYNQKAVAAELDAIAATGNLGGLVTAVANVPVAQGGQAFAALSGEVHASSGTVSYDQARQVQTSILSRLREPSPGLSTLPALAQGDYGAAYAADLPGRSPRPAEIAVAPVLRNHALWGEGFGSWGRIGTDGNAAGLKTSTGGFLLGADTPVGDAFRIGLAGGFARSSFDVTGRLSSGTNESIFGAIYGSGQWGPVSLRLGAAYAWHDIDTSRTVLLPGLSDRLTASYDGSTLQAFGELGYRFGLGRTALEPFIGASIMRLHSNAFRERGGIAALGGAGQDQDLATTTLGLRAEMQLFADLPLTLKGMIGWQHAYGDVRPERLMAFAGGTSAFAVAGLPIDRNALVAEAKLDWQASADLNLGIAYRGQIGSRAQNHAFTGNLTWRFATH